MRGELPATPITTAVKFCLLCQLFVCGFAISPALFGQDMAYVCENNGLTRSVDIVTEPGFACRVRYTKDSGTSYPWSARADSGYCGSRALFLVERLRSWGWACDSAEDVQSILVAQIERYHRHIKILNNVGKACNFYPAEVQFGDLCGDPRPEGAIVYACETGSDEWEQYLTVFLELESEPLIMEVGDSRSRQVTSYHIGDRRLQMEIQSVDTAANPAAPRDASIQCRVGTESSWELYQNQPIEQ
jgi:hypothetical protein